MVLAEIFEKVESKHAANMRKHGRWQETPEQEQRDAIHEEFGEWDDALCASDVDGPHGEISEAVDLITVLCRRIMFLTGEENA